MTISNTITLRNHLLTEKEANWTADAGENLVFRLALIVVIFGSVPLMLFGTWQLIFKREWWFPWDTAIAFPWLIIPCLLFGLWATWAILLKPWRSGRAKLNKLASNSATQADIDAWSKEVTGQIIRTTNGGMPAIMNDLTLEATMAGAMFKNPIS